MGRAEGHMLGLLHSAVDIPDKRLHAFASWLNTPDFIAPRTLKGQDAS